MKTIFPVKYLLLSLILFFQACGPLRQPVPPGTVPDQDTVSAADEQYGHAVFNALSERFKLDRDDARINRVRDIVDRLVKPLSANTNPWHVHLLVDKNIKNASATRGNYIFVWTGLIESVKNDDELATILAHEVAHLLAGHTKPTPAEEFSAIMSSVAGKTTREIVYQQGGTAGALSGLAALLVSEVINSAFIKPEQRRKEYEADEIGLFLMAEAGFDPEAAVSFWQRAIEDPDFQSFMPEFLSTHPGSEDRLLNLKKNLAEAQRRYHVHENGSFLDSTPESEFQFSESDTDPASDWTLN